MAGERGTLVEAVASATETAVKELFRAHPDDHFYYCSLITSGEASPPGLAAWSREALELAVSTQPGDPIANKELLKWSYADSPFFPVGEQHFAEVRRLFDALGVLDTCEDTSWEAAYDFKMSVMEEALALVDRRGAFGTGAKRAEIVINVEVMPPDYSNVERAMRLNPQEALGDWLREAAEPAHP